jgi:hypothetical protein
VRILIAGGAADLPGSPRDPLPEHERGSRRLGPRYPRPAMARRASASARVGLGVVMGLLVVLHVVPPHRGREPVLLGLPWDLAYHVLWMAGAAATIILVTRIAWSDAEDAGE